MTSMSLFKKFLLILVFTQVGGSALVGAVPARSPKNPKHIQGSTQDAEKILVERIRSATPEELQKGQDRAAKKLQVNVAKALMGLSKRSAAKEVPADVQQQAKDVLAAIKMGQLNEAMMGSLPDILVHVSSKAGPGQQLQTVISDVIPRAPLELKAPLQGVMDFVKANMNGVNNILNRVINGTPNLTQGVVSNLASTLGGVNGAVMGSMDSLNGLVGGLLSGGLIPSGVLPPLPGVLPGAGGTGGILG